jgi:hypothetical protein
MLLALTHRHGFTLADLCLDSVEKVHPRAAGREIALEFGVPLVAISLSKPVQKGCLLFSGQRLNRVLDLRKSHISIVPLRALPRPFTPGLRRHLAA